MAKTRPRQGWIYMINPSLVSLCCRNNHQYLYSLNQVYEVQCQNPNCNEIINSSRVLRGVHPYIIWTSNQFQDESNYVQTFTAIPLTSQTTFVGLPTTYPINNTTKNGLNCTSYALINQICTIDSNCFKDSSGNWLERIGQLSKNDKEQIKERLIYYLNLASDLSEDWFKQNLSEELFKKLFDYFPNDIKEQILIELMDNLD